MIDISQVVHLKQIQFSTTLNSSKQAIHFIGKVLFYLQSNHRPKMIKTQLLIFYFHLSIPDTFMRSAYLLEWSSFQKIVSFLNANLFASQTDFCMLKLPQNSIHSLRLHLTISFHKYFVCFKVLHLSVTNQ
jgi:hypothetical protein